MPTPTQVQSGHKCSQSGQAGGDAWQSGRTLHDNTRVVPLTMVVLQCRDRTFCQFFFSNETRKLTLICSRARKESETSPGLLSEAGSACLQACLQPLSTPQR